MVSRTERLSLLTRVASRFTSAADVALGVRIMGWALVLPILKHIVPVRSMAAMMCRQSTAHVRDQAPEQRVVTFARWAARLIRWRSGGNCLERGLIAYRYLGAAGAEPTLVVGLERQRGGGLMGHAWVLVDGAPVGETAVSLARYTPVFAFDHSGALLPAVPDSTSLHPQNPGFAPSIGT